MAETLLIDPGMGYFKRYGLMVTTASVTSFACLDAEARVKGPADLPRVKSEIHALVSQRHKGRHQDPRAFILKTVREGLRQEDRGRAFDIAYAVILEANRQHMDPLLLLAVIQTESHYNIKAKGDHGEIGLMQLMPATAQWLMKTKRTVNLEDPKTNIRAGALYLAKLKSRFPNHTHRAVSAYNMGATNVRRLIASKTEPRIYADRVYGAYRELGADLRRKDGRRIASR